MISFFLSGILHTFIQFLVDLVCCRLKDNKNQQSSDYSSRGLPRQQTPMTLETSPAGLITNDTLDIGNVSLAGPVIQPPSS